MSSHELFRRLVRLLFPADFRAAYATEMERTFADQQREVASGKQRGALFGLWWDTLLGLFRTAPREHLAQLRQDATYTLRMMRRTPGFTAVAVFTLATGLGASTAMFSVVHGVLLRPLPYPEVERVAAVWNYWPGSPQARFSEPELLDGRERLSSLDLAAYAAGDLTLTGPTLSDQAEPERLVAAWATANLLTVLGAQPTHGRDLSAADELAGSPRVALVSTELWQRRWSGSSDVLGSSLTLDGVLYEVVGVLPAGFAVPAQLGVSPQASLVLPLTLDPAAARSERGNHYLRAVARLRPGSSLDEGQAELDTLTAAFQRDNPGEYPVQFGATLSPLASEVVGDARRPLLLLLGAVGLVLLIGCANVANLLLARGQVRAREIAIRKAVGASDARLVRQVLTESLVLAGIAGLAGLWLASQLIRLVASMAPAVPRISEVAIEPLVLAFAAVITAMTALTFGLLPAVQLARSSQALALRADRGARSTIRPGVRAALVAAQVALALILLVGAGLLLRSFGRLLAAPAGFDPNNALAARLSLPAAGYPQRQQSVAFFDQLLDGLRSSPGVVAAGAVAGLPLDTRRGDWDFYLEGETPGPHGSDRPADWQVITPGYFEAMGIRLVSGRAPSGTDRADSQPVVWINETLARTHFPDGQPLDRQIRLSGDDRSWMTIAGVVGDVRHDGLDRPPAAELYVPYAQFRPFWSAATLHDLTLVVRGEREPTALAGLIRQQVRELDPNLPVWSVATLDQVVARSLAEQRLHMTLLAGFAAVALILALVGTYGVLAYQVTERTRELGVRMALGATSGDILRLTLWQGMAPALIGVFAGLLGAAALSHLLAQLLFEVRPLDGATFAGTASLLLGAALLACWAPARRATRLAPAGALRAD